MDENFLVDINPNMELPKYSLELHKLNEEPITSLKNIKGFRYKAYKVGMDEIEFDIPFYRMEPNGDKIKNEIYDIINGEYLILLNNSKYFIINKVSEQADNNGAIYKSVHAFSREYELSHKKLVDYREDSRMLYDETNSMLGDIERGVLNYIFNHITRSWSIGYVDPDVIFKNGKNVYRALDFPDTNLLQVFEELQKTYHCLFQFDTIKQTISIYDIDKQLGQHRGLYISDYNFIKDISKEANYDEIKTRLYVYGKDNTSIQSISPTGQPYLDNFNAYKNTNSMTQGLIDALNAYDEKVKNYNPDFEPLLQELQNANKQMEELINADDKCINNKGLVALQRELSQVQTLIDVKTEELAILKSRISKAEGTKLSGLYDEKKAIETAIDELIEKKTSINGLIDNKQEEINVQQTIIDGIKEQINNLQYELDVNNPENFTAEQLKELDKFVRIETYNDSNYTEHNIVELYEEGKRLLNKISQPKIQFNVNVVDFLSIVECQHVWDRFILGDIVTLEHKELGFNYDVRLVGYEHDVDSNSLDLQFSNTNSFEDSTIYLADLLEDFNTTASTVDFNKFKWEKVDKVESNISKYVDLKLEETRQNILNAVGQRHLFDDRGLWLYKENADGTVNDEQIRAINNTIALTTDNWATTKWALDPSGINAEVIRGKLGQFARIMANQIEVGNNGETLPDNVLSDNVIKQNKNYNGVTINSEDGMSVWRTDSKAKVAVNATDGISLYSDIGNGLERNFYVDINGKIRAKNIEIDNTGIFKGDITGASGTFTGIINAKDYQINGVSILNNNKIKGNYIESITTDQLTAGQAKISTALIENLEVGRNVTMGSNATISWNNVTDQPYIPSKYYIESLALDKIKSTYIDYNGIWTPSVYATNINTLKGKISTAQIESLEVGKNVTMGSNATISWNNVTNQPYIPSKYYITTITNDTIKTTNVIAKNLQVNSANILGTVTADKVKAGTVIATSSSGARVELNGEGLKNGLYIYNNNGYLSGTLNWDNLGAGTAEEARERVFFRTESGNAMKIQSTNANMSIEATGGKSIYFGSDTMFNGNVTFTKSHTVRGLEYSGYIKAYYPSHFFYLDLGTNSLAVRDKDGKFIGNIPIQK